MIRTGLGAALLAAALLPMPVLSAQQALLPGDWARPVEAPALAAGVDGTVVATFVSGEEIWAAVSRDQGNGFDAPVRVGARGKVASGKTWGPRVAVTPDAIVVTAVHGERLRGRDGDLFAWRSTDRGRTWQGPVRVNDRDGAPREGMHAMAAAPDGLLFTVWLDKLGQGMRLSGAWSADGGATWGEDHLLYASPDGSICQCCVPAATFEPDGGRAVVLWRNWLDGNRDMYALTVQRSDGPRPAGARMLGDVHWPLDACPVSNAGVAFSPQGTPITFWRRETTLYVSTPGGAAAKIDEGRETTAASGPDGAHLVWVDLQGRVRTMTRSTSSGRFERRAHGRGYSASVAGAPDGLGPVLALWQAREEGPEALSVLRLADRRPGRTTVKSTAGGTDAVPEEDSESR